MPHTKKLHILVVEDYAPERALIINAITNSGFDVDIKTAESVDDALMICINNTFDCVFLDYYFPEKNGIEFISSYTARGETGSIIMVTSQEDVKMAVDCMKMGAVDYLTKNVISPTTISKSLNYVMKLKQARDNAALAEKKLLASELKLKSIIDKSPIIFFNIDNNEIITLFKGKASSHISPDANQIVGKSLSEISEILPLRIEDYRKACAEIEFNFKTEVNGRHFDVNYIPVKNEVNVITGMMGVAIDITTFKKNEDSLKNTIEETEASSKIKEQFLANMSHEIRTPIHGIISLTQFVLNTPVNDEQKKYLSLIKKSADTLLVIINDILDLSKIDSGKMTFEQVEFNLKDTIQTAVAGFIPKTIEKNIQLKTELSANLPSHLEGDPVRLTQIFNNLLGNAIKFTDKGFVSIAASINEKNDEYVVIEFRVKDTGIGIPSHKINSIFESFTQAGTDITRKYGGTGLGLSITKQLIEKQDGTVHIESELGEGTTFSFKLPFKLVKFESVANNTSAETEIKFSKSIDVLVAEDNDINRFIIEKMLLDWGLNADFAATGTEAVDMSSKKKYDIILMDIEMPDMNGYRATEIIRQFDNETKNIPIIAMTGHAMTGEQNKCILAGMNDYISKPFKPEELKKKICLLTGSGNCKDIALNQQLSSTTNENTNVNSIDSPTKNIDNLIEEKPIIKFTNMQFLKEISENNEQFYREFIQMFLANTPNSINEMVKANDTQNWEALRQAAHKVKPSFNYVGLKDLNVAAAKIEECAKAKENLGLIPVLLKQINEISVIAFKELEEELQSLTVS